MAGEIISIVAQATTQSVWIDNPVISSASQSDAARLSDLLSVQQVQQVQPPTPDSLVTPVAGEIKASSNGLGDKILNAWDAAGKQYKDGANRIDTVMGTEGASMSLDTALRLQLEMFKTSMQVDLMSKFMAKTGQHIDTLTKLQ